MARVAVFGGSGFIGSYLVEELLKRGYEVVVADLKPSIYFSRKYFVECDILDEKKIDEVVVGCQYVFNLAGFASLEDSVKHPKKTIELNVLGNLNILEACKKFNIDRFVYASSAYALNDKGSFYGISKLTSEKIIEEYYKRFGLKFTIIRYGSVYGEREFYNNYIYNLIKEAILTGEINHHGDGEEIREYIHAADAAKLSVDIIEDEKFVNEHIILTGIEKMKRKELFEMINEIYGGTIKINFLKNGYDTHYKITPYSFNPTKSKKLVANPFIDMGQGVLECIQKVVELTKK